MKQLIAAGLLSITLIASAFAADEILIADFEKDTYAPWTVTGGALGPGPLRGTMPGQMHVVGSKGRGLVNAFSKGDNSLGSLTSPEFRTKRKIISLCPRYRGQRDLSPVGDPPRGRLVGRRQPTSFNS
ncbi:MAG: hypothetical protein RL088_1593 [Verrucomicrobiota bacterium]|jgi:hypothetical protein